VGRFAGSGARRGASRRPPPGASSCLRARRRGGEAVCGSIDQATFHRDRL
jgi:hypothetical protein